MSKGYIGYYDNFFKIGNSLKKIHIKTKPFYRKYNGMISIDNDALLVQETDKAILIREKIQIDEEDYSKTPIWISKSILLERYDTKTLKK